MQQNFSFLSHDVINVKNNSIKISDYSPQQHESVRERES